MEEIDVASVTKRSIHGVFALVSRTFLVQIIGLVANFLLTVFLTPSIFGIYYIVTAVIAFLQYFSDIGLAAALIQKKDAITDKELQTTFTIQQALVVSVCIIALLLSAIIGKFYHLQADGILLFQALVVSFFLSSLKTIPSIILERNLRFEKLVIPQIVETLFFNLTAVVLAFKGFGVYSFVYAVLLRGLSGVIAIYIINPWRIRFGFSKEVAKRLLSFGIPFQTNSFLALIKDDLLLAYLGKILPVAQVGYIGFAQKYAFYPLRLIMDNVIRITFPSFSRLQHDERALSLALEKSLFASAVTIFPALAGLIIVAPYFIELIPKYSKWEPALLSLTFFAFSAVMSSISTPLTNVLSAIGKIKISLYLMVFWTIATWVLTPVAILIYGFNGVSIASFVIALSVLYVVYLVKKHINFRFISTIKYPLIASIGMGIVLSMASNIFVKNFLSLFLIILLGVILYMAFLLLVAKEQIISDIKLIKENIKR